MESVAKPAELLALYDVTAELFDTLKRWFSVPDQVSLDLTEIDSAVTQLGDPVAIAALAMRKLQALRLLSQPGVRTSTDVVVTIVQDLGRALVQAPTMRLHHAAEAADWDAELAALIAGGDTAAEGGPEATEAAEGGAGGDPEGQRFRALHGRLHAAVRAVVEVSDGEVRYLI